MTDFQAEVEISRSSPHRVHDLRVTQRQIPLGVYKGLLKFTSYTAGGMAAFGNLPGRHNKVTSWLCSGPAVEKDMAVLSTVPLPAVYY